MIANPERGEVEVVLDGKPRPLRPSYEAIRAIELELNTTLASLCARAIIPSGLQISEIESILFHGMTAAGKDRNDPFLTGVKRERLGELAYRAGVTNVIDPVGAFLSNALNGGMPVERKKKDETTEVASAIAS